MPWTTHDIPSLDGKLFVVTGANSGLGLETTRALARKGARVVMACRSQTKAERARDELTRAVPGALLELVPLDLADLASVREAAERIRAEHAHIDCLVNNAGVMALPRRETADGFEMQFGTNHLGHFALTGLLLDRLLGARHARVVTVSSHAHRVGGIHFDDLSSARRYNRWLAYAQSKLANLLFSFELARRLEKIGADTLSVACHPGYAATNLQTAGAAMEGARWFERLATVGNRLLAQSAADGALPTLYAAVAPGLHGGDYVGPAGPLELAGPPHRSRAARNARDPGAASRLWGVSEELTGVRFTALTN